MAIQEVLLINDEIRDAINNENMKREDLRELVYQHDVTTLLQDGLEKVIEGFTTFEEIYKLIEIENDLDEQYGEEFKKITEDLQNKIVRQIAQQDQENTADQMNNQKEAPKE